MLSCQHLIPLENLWTIDVHGGWFLAIVSDWRVSHLTLGCVCTSILKLELNRMTKPHPILQATVSSMIALILIPVLARSASADRQIRFDISLNEKSVLFTTVSDQGEGAPEDVWRYLALSSNRVNPVGDYNIEPEPKNSSQAILKGNVSIKSTLGESSEISELKLIRSKKYPGKWRIDPSEVERMLKVRVSAGKFPVGTFTASRQKDWSLKFEGGGKLKILRSGELVAEGTYKATENEISMTDEKGRLAAALDDAKTGRYRWKLQDGKLTFKLLEDKSRGRELMLTLNEWTEQK